ncbi:MAG TPA: 3-oxoacyl-ACP reductase [Jatrophihabitans sp.]
MSDKYLEIINSPFGKTVASRLGLPRPIALRRYAADQPLLNGSLLLGSIPDTGLPDLYVVLSRAGVDVRTIDDAGERWGALVFDATGTRSVADLAALRDFFAGALRRLKPTGRAILIGRAPDGVDPAVDAARHALDGIVRSLAKEVRAGATANLVLVDSEVPADGVESALRFLLSGRSAYVDGQVVRIGSGDAPEPADWSRPLDGKVAVVTGAARGIGAAIATVLARDGATVIAADLPAAGAALAGVANRVRGTALQLDIAAVDAAERLTAHAESRHGGLDIVVHNAGITRDKTLANMTPQLWDSVLAVNLESQLRINAALLADKTLRDGGRVICLASTSGIAGNRGQTNYAASKAGVIGMVRSYAPAFAEQHATINAVAPGFIDTDMTHAMPFATREVARRLNSLQQASLPIDVAETVGWLAWPATGGVTGQVLRVCGQNIVGA